MECDFCSEPNPKWMYRAGNYVSEIVDIAESLGGWAACDVCKALIEKNERVELAERGTRSFVSLHPEVTGIQEDIFYTMLQIHEEFFEHRVGEAIKT